MGEWTWNWQNYDCVSARANPRAWFRGAIAKAAASGLVFQKIQQINPWRYSCRRSCIWQPCFSADCDRLSSSAGISLGGSKDSRLFPCFSEMTDVRAQLSRSGGAHSSWAGESWRTLRKEAAAAASCYATIPVFSKRNVWVY